MQYTHDEYRDKLITLGACNSRAGTAVLEYALRYSGGRHEDSAFWRLERVFVKKEKDNLRHLRMQIAQGL
jgi:hypothetical protein